MIVAHIERYEERYEERYGRLPENLDALLRDAEDPDLLETGIHGRDWNYDLFDDGFWLRIGNGEFSRDAFELLYSSWAGYWTEDY